MPDKPPVSVPVAFWRWATGAGLAIVGVVLTYAVELHNWKLAQLAALGGVALLAGGVAFLASALSSSLAAPGRQDTKDQHLTRLGAAAAFGLAGVILYSFQYRNWSEGRVLLTCSVGLIAAGAA